MADLLTLLAIGIPATAVASFALFLVYNRGAIVLLKAREGDMLIGGFLTMLAGHLTLLLGVTSADAGLTSLGGLLIGVGIALCCVTGILLIQHFEKEQGGQAKVAEAEARGRAQLGAVVRATEATGVGLLLVDRDGAGKERVALCNLPAAALIGGGARALEGKPLRRVLEVEEADALAALAKRARERPGEPLSAGFTLVPGGGGAERIPVELALTYHEGEAGLALAVTLVDARAKHSALAAARDARSDADFYLDLVTHDMSNFNQGALGYLELIDLNRDGPPEKRDRFEANALRQVRNSARLIENVKLLSVIRNSHEPLGPVDALYALHDAIDHVVFSWTEKEVEVRLVPLTEQHTVVADMWLRDLFEHLLDNAVKFSPERRVEVAVSVGDGVGGKSLIFRIADSGRGISPEEREIILDRLGSRRRDYSAYRSGIGLFIVKTIADRYGGRLWIEERVPGEHAKGSVFCLEVPRE